MENEQTEPLSPHPRFVLSSALYSIERLIDALDKLRATPDATVEWRLPLDNVTCRIQELPGDLVDAGCNAWILGLLASPREWFVVGKMPDTSGEVRHALCEYRDYLITVASQYNQRAEHRLPIKMPSGYKQ